jgi:hypothetical protein
MTVPHTAVPFREAANYVLPFGKYQGRLIDEIARTDQGLLYLDWLRSGRMDYHTRNAICSYLDDPTIAKDLVEIVARNDR